MQKNANTFIFAAALALCCAAGALAAPAQVILIRHAEKPEYGNQLSERGFRRAEALVRFFLNEAAVTRYGAPAAIYAAAPKHEDSSIRSIQTVQPLAGALGQEPIVKFTRGQARKLAADIMENPAYDGRMVLVCWQHGNIYDIALELAQYNGSPQSALAALPGEWPDGVYDRVWLLDFNRGELTDFSDIPQNLLPGDSDRHTENK
jgi:hypothetical protein